MDGAVAVVVNDTVEDVPLVEIDVDVDVVVDVEVLVEVVVVGDVLVVVVALVVDVDELVVVVGQTGGAPVGKSKISFMCKFMILYNGH